ncbi:hypothetical protein JOE32_000247 [Pseudomonas sp. PvP025]|jgi:hypothetical protein|uniref:hypothetical protein n=1 Tax=Pseudomonas sp. W5-01 TaxID=3097454 RepID=UPI001B769AC0|nr:hypothetical protein [Pseudomonas sp. PvP025]MDQ0397640.1 hypothetical protein [Pseudomonas sp. PvP006]WQG58310.1 hypothetical protein RHM66_00680 [Pseudomonas sp. RTB3]
MHPHSAQRLSDSSWLLHQRDLVPEESTCWWIEWGVMQLLHRRQVTERGQPRDRQA